MNLPNDASKKFWMSQFVFALLLLQIVLFSQTQAIADLKGDSNRDGYVNNVDIMGFAIALFNRPMYEMMYPDADPDFVLDMNRDTAFNNKDIAGFAAVLFSPPSVQPPTDLQAITTGSSNLIGLGWTASTSPDVTGYQILYGLSSGNLDNSIDVGNVTSASVAGLTTGQTYFMSVIACTDDGQSKTEDALISAQTSPTITVVNLFSAATALEAPTTVETPDALTTYLSDRVRDRHARESQFQAYDHYLSWYWEQRMMNIEIVDRIGRNGGDEITFNYTTQRRLNPAEFRTFYRGITTSAEYSHNQIADLVSTNPSDTPGETDYNYTASITYNTQQSRPIQVGDRVEIEISQFLLAPRNGRSNYYGTTLLYIVGEGIVPWGEGQDLGFNGGVVGNVIQRVDSYPLPTAALLGGQTTLSYPYSNEPDNAFKQTATNLSPTSGFDFMLGRRLHHTDFGSGAHSESGNPIFAEHVGELGPKYIARSCVACHVNNGRALPPAIGASLSQSVVKVGSDAVGSIHPTLGAVLQPRSTAGSGEGSASISSYITVSGTYGDGSAYSLRQPNYAFSGTTPSHYSVRIAPNLVGMGLLEAISENSITALADPADSNSDGISGRVQIVADPETGQSRLGRFGYKGGRATVRHQVATALSNDMGVTNSLFPTIDGAAAGGAPELSDEDLDLMNRYTALLGVQARRDLTDSQALLGETLFSSAGCADCHTTEFTTGAFHPMTEVRGQTIHPYTDLLLHDMGPGLADNLGEGIATGSEWRTSPLWNIGHTAGVNETGEAYLHDGRARNLEEAILWHGGEGEASKETFRTMSAANRAALIAFLKSL